MPVVALFDGQARQVFLDASIVDSSWAPLDVYREYREWRSDPVNQRWDPLLDMIGGEPKGGGSFFPRALRLRVDRSDLLTKIVPPNSTGVYRTLIDGEIVTAVPDIDPEPFNVAPLTHPVIFDYKPPTSEVITVGAGSGGDTSRGGFR